LATILFLLSTAAHALTQVLFFYLIKSVKICDVMASACAI